METAVVAAEQEMLKTEAAPQRGRRRPGERRAGRTGDMNHGTACQISSEAGDEEVPGSGGRGHQRSRSGPHRDGGKARLAWAEEGPARGRWQRCHLE